MLRGAAELWVLDPQPHAMGCAWSTGHPPTPVTPPSPAEPPGTSTEGQGTGQSSPASSSLGKHGMGCAFSASISSAKTIAI